MQIYKVNGELYKNLVINGAANLKANYKVIDALNVFPVPDGDTGTNMRMTMEAGVNEIRNIEEDSIYEMSKKLSRGMLMGARGNSGVILSQLFRGIYKGLANLKEVGAPELANAFVSGVEQAYRAVLKPVEGTILTVAREAAHHAKAKATKDSSIQEFFEYYLQEARASLNRTPDLLPVLKEAGVIDSGGAGFICIVEGMQKYLNGEVIADTVIEVLPQSFVNRSNFNAHSDLEYGYCTEFILQLQYKKVDIPEFDVKIITEYLESIGDSIVALRDEDIVKVHVHTKIPGEVLAHCQQYGEFLTLKIENMSVQHTAATVSEQECGCDECVEMRRQSGPKKFGIISVASGDGLVKIFKEMGVDYVVEGGQSMNPSAEYFVKGFDAVNAENIIVFPNNSNIILTAEQAAKYYNKKKIYVVKSKTIAQGYSALTMLDLSSGNIKTILAEIDAVIENVTTGLITYSIRDAEIEGVSIREGDYIGICNGKIIVSEDTKINSVKSLIERSDAQDRDIITVIYGKDVSPEELQDLQSYLADHYQNLEVDMISGGQEIYSYILSIE